MSPPLRGATLLSLLLANPPRVLTEQAALHRGQGMDWTADLYELLARDHDALVANLRTGAAVSEIERHEMEVHRYAGASPWIVFTPNRRAGCANSIVEALHAASPVASSNRTSPAGKK